MVVVSKANGYTLYDKHCSRHFTMSLFDLHNNFMRCVLVLSPFSSCNLTKVVQVEDSKAGIWTQAGWLQIPCIILHYTASLPYKISKEDAVFTFAFYTYFPF